MNRPKLSLQILPLYSMKCVSFLSLFQHNMMSWFSSGFRKIAGTNWMMHPSKSIDHVTRMNEWSFFFPSFQHQSLLGFDEMQWCHACPWTARCWSHHNNIVPSFRTDSLIKFPGEWCQWHSSMIFLLRFRMSSDNDRTNMLFVFLAVTMTEQVLYSMLFS
jgi:hypothetical protein